MVMGQSIVLSEIKAEVPLQNENPMNDQIIWQQYIQQEGTLPAYCIPKIERLKTGEVLYEKSYMSLRPPPKISLRHDHDWTRGNDELGCTVEQQPVGKLVEQSFGEVQHATFSQLTQPKPKPICDRLCSEAAADNPLDLLALPAQHRHRNTFVVLACTARMR